MFVDEVRRAVEAAPRVKLAQIGEVMWRGWAAGQISDAEAEELSVLIEAKRALPPPERPARVYVGSRPRTAASMQRRRSWAASGRLPPHLANKFTLAEVAVLSVVSIEVAKHGACTLTIGHLGAVAGVSPSTVRNAVREAQRLGLLRNEERRLTAWRNAPNRITITSSEWISWLRLGPKGGGYKSLNPTPTKDLRRAGYVQATAPWKGCRRAAAEAEARTRRESSP